MGKILYTPPGPGPDSVMVEVSGGQGGPGGIWGVPSLTCLTSFTQVNRTFQELAVLGELGGAWQELGPLIYTILNSSLEMQVLQVCDPRLLPLGTGLQWGARWGVLGCSWPGAGWDAAGARWAAWPLITPHFAGPAAGPKHSPAPGWVPQRHLLETARAGHIPDRTSGGTRPHLAPGVC